MPTIRVVRNLVVYLAISMGLRAHAGPPPSVDPSHTHGWLRSAQARLHELGITSVTYERRLIDNEDLLESDLPAAVAATLANLPDRPDWADHLRSRRLVDVDTLGILPVAVDVQGQTALVEYTEKPVSFISNAPVSKIKRKWGLNALAEEEGAPWDPHALASLDAALGLLTPTELDIITDLSSIVRSMVDPDPEDGAAGKYFGGGTDSLNHVEIYNSAFKGAEQVFVGPASAPMPSVTGTILHEFGHAFAARPARYLEARHMLAVEEFEERRLVQAARSHRLDRLRGQLNHMGSGTSFSSSSSYRKKRELYQREMEVYDNEHDALSRRSDVLHRQVELIEALGTPGPIVHTYARIPGVLEGPTEYGRTDAGESFAEAFAWWHEDPEGYRRAYPEAAAWFERGGHIAALKQALAAIDMLSR